jgi:predicted GIY-YIG superfamily endonuclease
MKEQAAMTDDDKEQDNYVTYALAQRLLGVGNTVMSRLIATGELPFTEHPFDKRQKLIRRSDISRIRELGFLADSSIHHTVTTWIIYALIDPRDETIRYIGRTIRTKRRLQQHLQEIGNKKKSRWLKELKKLGITPRMEILERLDCKAIDAERREAEWIQHLVSEGAPLTNIRSV